MIQSVKMVKTVTSKLVIWIGQ